MFNTSLFDIVRELNDGRFDQYNPIVKEANKVFYDIIQCNIEMWNDFDASDKGFEDRFYDDFPPGFLSRDISRAKQIIFDLRDIADGEAIRFELAPIYTYVMYHLIRHWNEWQDDIELLKNRFPQSVKDYLREKKIHPRSNTYRYIKSWFTDKDAMHEDFEETYNGDYVSAGFAELVAGIYLDDTMASTKLNMLRVTIDEFFDLLPNDLYERVQKKYRTEQEQAKVQNETPMKGEKAMDVPNVFISYSWEDEAHKAWVKALADRLLSDGINAIVDQYDLTLGDRLPQFMEQQISQADYVLIICTPTYKEKSDARTGGVGYEGHIISGELYAKHNERKFIPVVRKGSFSEVIPTFLAGKLGIDLSGKSNYEDNYNDLITTVRGIRKKPAIGEKPKNVPQLPATDKPSQEKDEPIHILGIITDEVTTPKMDGTRGSALYKIPFRLSQTPSRLWRELFINEWNEPPRFTTMHRPGIASVYGDRIILDGTTIEEVRDYHRETLLLCVDEANKKEAEIIAERKREEELREQRKRLHSETVSTIAKEIKF